MYLIYSALLGICLILGLPYWLWQMLRHGKYRKGFGERLGRVPDRLLPASSQRVIWLHAVSVGEVQAVNRLVQELRRNLPNHRVVVSTTTDTGQRLARERFGGDNVFYVPLDFSFALKPYFAALKPELVILAETEFWPNFLRHARERGVRVAVVNARISDRSLPGYRRWKGFMPSILGAVDLFLAQSDEDKRRLEQIGAPGARIQVSGNLKYDAPVPRPTPIAESLRATLEAAIAGPVIVCGSTVDVEEESLLLRAFENVLASYPRAVMILAPRQPQRFAQVARLLERLSIRFWRRSLWNGEAIIGGVFLLDSIGELASVYALGDIAFVGGSLVPHGGHNILEPAQHGLAIVVGNHTANFRDIVGLFQSRNAVRVVGPAELPLVFMELISNNDERIALGRHAAETVRTQMGATQRTVDALRKLQEATNKRAAAL